MCCFVQQLLVHKSGLCFIVSQETRLRDRQTETEESLQKRLEAARIDMELSEFLSCSSWIYAEIKITIAAD